MPLFAVQDEKISSIINFVMVPSRKQDLVFSLGEVPEFENLLE